jgi:hypothetical protein
MVVTPCGLETAGHFVVQVSLPFASPGFLLDLFLDLEDGGHVPLKC